MAKIKQKTTSVVDLVSPLCLESYLARFLAQSLRPQADRPFAFAATPVLLADPGRHQSLRDTSVSRRQHWSRALEFAAEGQQPSSRSWPLVLGGPAATAAEGRQRQGRACPVPADRAVGLRRGRSVARSKG